MNSFTDFDCRICSTFFLTSRFPRGRRVLLGLGQNDPWDFLERLCRRLWDVDEP